MWKDDPEYSFKQNLNSRAFLECVMELRSFLLLFVSSSSLSPLPCSLNSVHCINNKANLKVDNYWGTWLTQSVEACNSWSQESEFKSHFECRVYIIIIIIIITVIIMRRRGRRKAVINFQKSKLFMKGKHRILWDSDILLITLNIDGIKNTVGGKRSLYMCTCTHL